MRSVWNSLDNVKYRTLVLKKFPGSSISPICFHLNSWEKEHLRNPKTRRGSSLDLQLQIPFCQNKLKSFS
jgi:hypothetical protein